LNAILRFLQKQKKFILFIEPISHNRILQCIKGDSLLIQSPHSLDTSTKLTDYLKAISSINNPKILSKVLDEGTGSFAVHFDVAVKVLQQDMIERVIQGKHGDHSRMIFRLLLMKGKLEEKQIAKLAMLPVKLVREKLYTLFKSGFINIQVCSKI